MTYNARAYAKVNLHLEVLNKRSDLYHNIFSFNASLDIFDQLILKRVNVIKKNSGDISIDIHPEGGEYVDLVSSIENRDNLITKAVKSYLNRIEKSAEISLSIEKNIPAGAGLGGGSSDAAAALRLLNNYFNKINEGLSESELSQVGASIGADIPYCLSGSYALCEGIGEIVESIEGRLNYWILVADPGIKVNTGDAYNALKRSSKFILTRNEIDEKKRLFRKGLKEGEISRFKHILKNDFEEPIFSVHPVLKIIKDEINEYMPEYVSMTGSGSGIIGLFKDRKKAMTAQNELSKKLRVRISRFI